MVDMRYLFVVLICCYSFYVSAHDLTVKRNSNFRQDSSTASPILLKLKPGDELLLLRHKTENGYYQTLHKDGVGWVWGHNVSVLPEYVRNDWKHWVDADGDCQRARDEVLIAESEITVTFKTTDNCKVASGRWTDPYTNEVFTDPGKLDVDHMIPLSNAHRSGGWEWSFQRREQYANDLNHTEHLIAVKASANRSKGAKSPDQWMPENEDYWCTYIENWEAIKLRWGLLMTVKESSTVNNFKSSCQ